jgi:hypothetical protein
MVSYDSSVIQQFAEALYKQARMLVIRYAIVCALIGFAAGYLMAGGARVSDASLPGFIVAIFGLVVGAMIGQGKAAALRLQAQQALCQVQIEKNTRPVVAATRLA